MAASNRKSKVTRSIPFQVMVPSDLLDDFREMADERGETVSVEVRTSMRERLRKHRAERQDQPA